MSGALRRAIPKACDKTQLADDIIRSRFETNYTRSRGRPQVVRVKRFQSNRKFLLGQAKQMWRCYCCSNETAEKDIEIHCIPRKWYLKVLNKDEKILEMEMNCMWGR